MDRLCKYGCGNVGIKQLSDGSWICSESWNACPVNRIKNQKSILKSYRDGASVNKITQKKECQFCHKYFGITVLKQHVKSCYLNPENLKLCPVCGEPIVNFKGYTTCSNKCRGQFFKDQYTQISRDYHEVSHSLSYSAICFRYHEKKCIICGEVNIVAVHHYDFNHTNDDPENLVPLCMTHHVYCHSRFYYLIKEKIEDYVNNCGIAQSVRAFGS